MTDLTNSFTGTGTSDAKSVFSNSFDISISGTFVATIALQKSYDGGSTWITIESFEEAAERTGLVGRRGVQYRFNCTAYTSGTAVCRLAADDLNS